LEEIQRASFVDFQKLPAEGRSRKGYFCRFPKTYGPCICLKLEKIRRGSFYRFPKTMPELEIKWALSADFPKLVDPESLKRKGSGNYGMRAHSIKKA
jgi:hypothetical protein